MKKFNIKENLDLYKGLKPGIVYIAFENENPIEKEFAGDPIYKNRYIGKTKKQTSCRKSKNNNMFITKISICEHCGTFKASKQLKKSICSSCLRKINNSKMLKRYYKNKANPAKKLEPEPLYNSIYLSSYNEIAIKSMARKITGEYQKVTDEHLNSLVYPDTFDDVLINSRLCA